MALTSDTHSSPNGVDGIKKGSASVNDEDLEDGEIFEEEDEAEATPSFADKPKTNVEIPAENAVDKKPKIEYIRGDEKEKDILSDGDEDKKSKKKKSKKHSDEEEEEEGKRSRESKKHRKNQAQRNLEKKLEILEAAFDGDDEEMLLVRGGSPLRYENDLDRWEDDEELEDEEMSSDMSLQRRRFRGRGMSTRGKRRGGRTRSSIPRKRKREESNDIVCKFYMQGKCHQGSECPYSHSVQPPRKMELCKFYMNDCCAKKDKCLYMHNDFPCKFYHTGLKCHAGKNCKFSHGKLNETLRSILLKHLETAPKEILGNFPRLSREGVITMLRGNEKKIPSLFDIKVPVPLELQNNPGSDGNITPMPSPTQHSLECRLTDRDEQTPDRERERDRERRLDRDKHRERSRNKDRERVRDRGDHERGRERHRHREKDKEKDKSKNAPVLESEQPLQHESYLEKHTESREKESINSLSGPALNNEEEVEFPAHLPKKQRELFLRIKQQQREANSDKASGDEEENDNGDEKQEENWYSSDEEQSPSSALPSILRNLTQPRPSSPSLSSFSTCAKSLAPSSDNALIMSQIDKSPLPSVISDIDINAVLKVLSSLQNQAAEKKTTEPPRVRDPRLRHDGGGDTLSSPQPPVLSTGDVDLRLQSTITRGSGDVDLRHLPFKPAPVHSAANEIDASLSSHLPIVYRLIPVTVPKVDYSSLKIQPRPEVNDPRLRRVMRNTEESTSRDPRQRLVDETTRSKPAVADPRQRVSLLPLPTPNIPPGIRAPVTPRYDEDHRTFYMDSDMRQLPPATPRIDDVYPSTSGRPHDPRQRSSMSQYDSDCRRNMYQGHTFDSDVDLRPQLNMHSRSQYSFNKH